MPITEDILNQFSAVLGPKGFTRDAGEIAPWLSDWRGVYHGTAAAMLSPKSSEEVSALVKIAAHNVIGLVPQGGNTSMVGGATPLGDGRSIIVSLRRMNQIRTLDAEGGSVVAEAGVILETLHKAANVEGTRFPLTLGAKGSATIGGLIATNAGGTQVLRFGTMRKLVLGIEAVLPDGNIYHGLAALKKDNRGYDLTQLIIGAEGTLGIITAANLRLVPAVADRAAAWIGLESPQVALKLLRFFEAQSANAIESFEIVPADSLALVLHHISGTRAPLGSHWPWQVLVEYVETVTGCVAHDALIALVADAHAAGLVGDATIAKNESEISAFWRLRDSISEAERASGPAMQHDISVPVDAMPDFMLDAAAKVDAAFPGVAASGFGHLGDGNIHFHVRAPKGVDAASWRTGQGKAASRMVYDLVTTAGGSISAEHGIGQMKRAELLRQSDPVRIGMLRAIKTAIDPQGIMNPGKLVPLASDVDGA
ncbi:MAG: FAD-binding oxidoreductase [Pseudomonadota bacterium]